MPIELANDEITEYNRIQIKCMKKCSDIVDLGSLNEHLSVCGLEYCLNKNLCNKYAKFIIKKKKYCSQFCFDFIEMRGKNEKNKFKIFQLIKKYKLTKNKMNIKFFEPENNNMEDGYELEE